MDVDRTTLPVVVGVDGSGSGMEAVRWAAAEAGRRRTPLRLVQAVGPAAIGDPGFGPEYEDMIRRQAVAQLAEAAQLAAEKAPGISVEQIVLDGGPVSRLVAESRRAALVVVGHRGLGGVSGLLLGSVAVALPAQAACPVVVVRGTATPGGPVVVGIDGSPVSESALAFAFEAADTRGAPLIAVHVWADTVSSPASAQPWDWDRVEQEQHAILAERLAGWGGKYPDVEIRRRVDRDRPSRVLVEHSAGAQLLVVGSRGRGGVAGLLLGSVSNAVLHRAECPVAVVRPAPARD